MNKSYIRLSKCSVSYKEIYALQKVLKSEFLGMGKLVKKFELMLSNFFGRETACVVNGTAALHLALECSDIGMGDEVLVPTVTYLSSFQAISATGAKPIPCNINPSNLLLDLNNAKTKINKNTKAIMPVHFAGDPGKLNEIYKFANLNNLIVIEDAAHAFGSIFNKKKIGSFGDISCFSFDGIKNITSGEGGCVVSSNKKLIQRIKDARLLSVEGDTLKRFKQERSWDFDVKFQGWRYHMSDLMAGIGIEQLKKSKIFFKKRKLLAKYYDYLFSDNSLVTFFKRDYNNIVPHIYVVRIRSLKDKFKLKELMLRSGIEIGSPYKPNHLLTYYKNKKNFDLLDTELVYNELISLPLHVDLNKKEIHYIVSKLNYLLNNNSDLFF
jgi:dTDP-4-amino-4,6-dideoxygalactose transaminase